MKKYIKTIEDIEALRNTDTKIYSDRCQNSYHKFINGILCFFTSEDKLVFYNTSFGDLEEHYIEVEDEHDYQGNLGWFWDDDEDLKNIDVLEEIELIDEYPHKYFPKYHRRGYQHFRPLTPREVEAYTGYKVVKEKSK